MAHTACPLCPGEYASILEHIKRRHPGKRLTKAQLLLTNLASCPCGAIGISSHGIKTHQAKSKCAGWSRARSEEVEEREGGQGGGGRGGGGDGRRTEAHRRSSPAQESPPPPPRRRPVPRVEGAQERSGEEDGGAGGSRRGGRGPEAGELALNGPARRRNSPAVPIPPAAPGKKRAALVHDSDEESVDAELQDRRRRGDGAAAEGAAEGGPAPKSFPAARSTASASPSSSPSPSPSPSPFPSPSPSPEPELLADLAGRFASLAACPTVYKPLPPTWSKPFIEACAARARAYVRDPSERRLFDFLTLPKVGLAPALKLASSTSAAAGKLHLEAYPRVSWPVRAPPPSLGSSLPVRVSRAVESGKLGRAAQLLDNNAAVAALSEETLDALRSKHPEGEDNPFSNRRGNAPSSLPELDDVLRAFRTFKPDTAPGVSGWTPSLLGHAIKSDDVQAFLALLTKQVAGGTAPGRALLCTSRLTPLAKSDGGIRPIACGELIYRLIAKTLMRHYFRKTMLLPWQFGVGTPGGVEPVTRALERALSGDLPRPYAHVTSLDFSNAFNSISRASVAAGVLQHAPSLFRAAKWAYNEPSQLVVIGKDGEPVILTSSEGVRQGDPLGPLLFSIGARNVLANLASDMGEGHAVLGYLDDLYLLSEQPGALGTAEASLANNSAGLDLNVAKCKEVALEDVAREGLKVLGTCVGSSDARAAFLAAKVEEQMPVLARLRELEGQESLLLLRQCISSNLRHLQRSLRTDDLVDPWTRIDNALLASFHHLRSSPRRLDTDAAIISLPARLGGMGLFSHAEVAPHARAAMAESADTLLKEAFAYFLPDAEVEDSDAEDEEEPELRSQHVRCEKAFVVRREELLESLPVTLRPVILDNGSPLARRWMAVIPFSAQLRLSTNEVAAGLHIRTLCPGKDDNCAHCAAANVTGHDDVCPARPRWRVARHEVVKRLLETHLKTIEHTRVTLEPFAPGTQLRTDVQLAGPGSFGSPVSEYDVTVVSAATFAGREPVAWDGDTKIPTSFLPEPFTPDNCPVTAAASMSLLHQLNFTEAEKHAKYDAIVRTPFHPLVISTGGTLSPSTIPIFSHWSGLMPNYSLFTRVLSLVLLRARARFFAF